MEANKVMHKDPITVGPEVSLAEVGQMMISRKISGMPVIDSTGKMLGIISEKDILKYAFQGNLHTVKVKDAMTKAVISFPPDANIEAVAAVIGEKNIRRVPIVDKGRVVGVISRRDIIRVAESIFSTDWN